jgi:hypothetical protein
LLFFEKTLILGGKIAWENDCSGYKKYLQKKILITKVDSHLEEGIWQIHPLLKGMPSALVVVSPNLVNRPTLKISEPSR